MKYTQYCENNINGCNKFYLDTPYGTEANVVTGKFLQKQASSHTYYYYSDSKVNLGRISA